MTTVEPCACCLANPDMPAGREREAERQIGGWWLCSPCEMRLAVLPDWVARLQALRREPGASLYGMLSS
jgi:hypothetical protein